MRLLRTFLVHLAASLLASPTFAADLLPVDRAIAELVDRYTDLQLNEQSIKPAAPADDATVLRRLTLDLVGRIPTAGELDAYVSSTDPQKKTQLVDRLMARGGFLRHSVDE